MGACVAKGNNIIISKINTSDYQSRINSKESNSKDSKLSNNLGFQKYEEINLSVQSINSIPSKSSNDDSNIINSNIIITEIKTDNNSNLINFTGEQNYDINICNINNDNSLNEIINLFNY